jgi:hypothetical protein
MNQPVRCAFAAAFLFAAFLSPRLRGQTVYEERVMEGSDGDDDAAVSGWERLDELRNHPLDLNRAGASELRRLPLFSPDLAEAVVRERALAGPFRDKRDFRERLGLDVSLMEAVDPYVTAGPVSRGAGRKSKTGRMRIRRGFPEPVGFRDGTYAGSSLQALTKAEIRGTGGLSAGILTEKDPGEKRWNDHVSGYAGFPALDGRLQFTAGCFEAEAGQGLVLWGPYAASPGSDPVGSVCRSAGGVSGVASSGESGRFSGCAAEWDGGSWSAVLLGSSSRLDASVDESGAVTAFRTAGLHRTASEIRGRGTCRANEAAGRGTIRFGGLTAGGTWAWTHYSRKVDLLDEERRPFGFRGRENASWGMDWDLSMPRFRFCGEWARSRGDGAAFIASLAVQSKDAGLCLSARKTGPDFHGNRGNGFGDGANETGWYMGFRAVVSERMNVSGYADLVRHPVRTWFSPLPSAESTVAVYAERKIGAKTELRARLRFRDGQDPAAAAGDEKTADPGVIRSFRLELDGRPVRGFRVRCRAESVIARGNGASSRPTERGNALSEEILWEPRRNLSIAAGVALFDTDSWDTRIIATESDWPGSFSMIPLYQKGRRWTVRFRSAAISGASVSIKLARIVHAFSESWGSGAERTAGDSEWEAGAQIDWRITTQATK